MTEERALYRPQRGLSEGTKAAIALWSEATTDKGSGRQADLVRDKRRDLTDFFAHTGKTLELVTALDVQEWQAELEAQGLAPATVYAKVSKVSSFYRWAMEEPALKERIGGNPVLLARPKAPKAYQTESTQALDDDETRALLSVVRERAAGGDLVGKRDYALLLLYMATGLRRNEVIRLRWKDVKVNGGLVITAKLKGGDYESIEVGDPRVADALLDYLAASGRLEAMTPLSPLWTRHDRAGEPGKALSSHAFVKNLKRYAERAGLSAFHLHQTRHTFGRMVAEQTGSIVETQHALGHKSESTTRVYVKRVAVKKDKHSKAILDRLL